MRKTILFFFIGGALIGLYVGFLIGSIALPDGPIRMADGYYRVYNQQKAYDTKTGEQIYWLIADQVKWQKLGSNDVPVHQNKIRFYQIPRQAVADPLDDGKPDKSLLTVREGKATFVKVVWPPKVFTR